MVESQAASRPGHLDQLSALRECDVRRFKVWPTKTDVGGIAVRKRNMLNVAGIGRDHADTAVDQGRDAVPPIGFHGQTVETLIARRPGDEPPAMRRRPRLGGNLPGS